MQTIKLCSTISYNTENFLVSKLNEMVKYKIIEYWFAVYHKPEADEKKSHFHVCFKPVRKLDTIDFREEFNEVVQNGQPLKCMPVRTSKSFDDWYLYAIHHHGYLMYKGESRSHHYSFCDVIGSDLELLHEMVNEIDISKYRCYEEIFKAVENHVPFTELIARGVVPLGWIYQFRELYLALAHQQSTVRNGRLNHEYCQDTLICVYDGDSDN